MQYEVEFAPGCRKHEDCRYNGVNLAQSDIDIGAATSGLEGFGISAMCHPGGTCTCSSSQYFGPACTPDGRGVLSIWSGSWSTPGNVPNMKCDAKGLYLADVLAVRPLRGQVFAARDVTGAVTRSTPTEIILSETLENVDIRAGDRIDMEGQIRMVVRLEVARSVLHVANAFVEWGRSTTTHIMAPLTALATQVATQQYDGSRVNSGAQCHVTDIRRVSDSSSACGSDRPTHCATAVVGGTGDQTNRLVTLSGPAASLHEIVPQDRIRLVTTNFEAGEQVWETRTVQSVIPLRKANGLADQYAVQSFIVETPYSAAHANVPVFVDTSGTTELLACSRRGDCSATTGECDCVPGYGMHDCSRQNAMAV